MPEKAERSVEWELTEAYGAREQEKKSATVT
ncbi:hypothetical protein J2Y67_000206 [Neobacillus niacini]|nr:hypothetical protein [Neobacillus niacini]